MKAYLIQRPVIEMVEIENKNDGITKVLIVPQMGLEITRYGHQISFRKLDHEQIELTLKVSREGNIPVIPIEFDEPDANEITRCAEVHKKVLAMFASATMTHRFATALI
ncbi:MAG: hypothetical protein Q7R65_00200 [bacterium]|nr:hypothetical protein [bacterium]